MDKSNLKLISFSERVKSALTKLEIVAPGVIFHFHKDKLFFGTEEKPNHYALCPDDYNIKQNYFKVHPCTSVIKKGKGIFRFNLKKDSNIKIISIKDSFLMFYLIRQIKYDVKVSEEKQGRLNEETYKRFLLGKQNYIKSNFKG